MRAIFVFICMVNNQQAFHMKNIFISTLLLFTLAANAQPTKYSVANAHSHNDYEQDTPFYKAYNAGFGSIEADIFLIKGRLIVAHDLNEVKKNRTLEEYYLNPLASFVQKNNGHAYAAAGKKLQMLIDIKTGAGNTLDSLVALLKRYPQLSNNKSIRWVITGNRPPDSTFTTYPSFILFDALAFKDYQPQVLTRLVMASDDFKIYSAWDGNGKIPAADITKLTATIAKWHALHIKVRFWDAPDNANAWQQFMALGVDYINTDNIRPLAAFLQQH